jgi:hypothetical protein
VFGAIRAFHVYHTPAARVRGVRAVVAPAGLLAFAGERAARSPSARIRDL